MFKRVVNTSLKKKELAESSVTFDLLRIGTNLPNIPQWCLYHSPGGHP